MSSQPNFPIVLDNTMVSAYRACPRKFWWRHQRHLQKGEISIHLISGGAFAKGLEVTRKQYYDFGDSIEVALAKGAAALIAAYGFTEPSPKYSNKSVFNLVGALAYYFEVWPINRLVKPWQPSAGAKHAIEWNFSIPIPGIVHPQTGAPILYCGRFDMVGQWENGMLMGEDDKTTSQLGQSWYMRWRLANQMLGYSWGAREHGINLAGFLIRGVSLLKNKYENGEAQLMINPWHIDRFVSNLQLTVRKMIQDWKDNSWAYDFGGACSAYGGCDYLELCESHDPEAWIGPNFNEFEWNPLHSRD
jgi:hypothetical protein